MPLPLANPKINQDGNVFGILGDLGLASGSGTSQKKEDSFQSSWKKILLGPKHEMNQDQSVCEATRCASPQEGQASPGRYRWTGSPAEPGLQRPQGSRNQHCTARWRGKVSSCDFWAPRRSPQGLLRGFYPNTNQKTTFSKL